MAGRALRNREEIEPYVHYRESDRPTQKRGAVDEKRDGRCCCHNCRRNGGKPRTWPSNMLGIPARVGARARACLWMSYECHVERQSADRSIDLDAEEAFELEEVLAELRNDPVRDGAFIVATDRWRRAA